MNFKIRDAQKEDAVTIQQLAYEIWPKTYGEILGNAQIDYMLSNMYNPKLLADQMISKQQIYLLLYLDEIPVGFTSYGKQEDAFTYKLHKIYVSPTIQGKGLGKILIQEVEKRVIALGAQNLLLNVNRFNLKAIEFYKKQGYELLETVDISIGEGYLMEDYILGKKL